MPSATIAHRRRRSDGSDDGGDDGSSKIATPSSQPYSNKKARLNINGDASPSQRPVLPDGYLSQSNGFSQMKMPTSRAPSMRHQPGSIVRVKLANFVTYTAVEFFPGPSLNMVIGPNGTGKSSLVCAICLGLGWGPQHLGRAKEVSEFVKHGFQEAMIEIELAGDGKRFRRNPVIRCNIKREGSKTHFSVNGKPSNKKGVMELAKSFSIQIDNLCQFLPQDKVVEFAAMTPVELLHSTQRAVAPQGMLDWHDELKQLRRQQRTVQAQDAADQDILTNLEGRQRMQEADVERMRERELMKTRVRMLEACRPFAKYREARNKHSEAKARRRVAATELKALEDEVEPSMLAVNAKECYRDQIKAVVHERAQVVQRADRNAQSCAMHVNGLDDRIKDIQREKEAEKNGSKQSKQEASRFEQIIARLHKQMEQQPVELDVSACNEQMRERDRAVGECTREAVQLQALMTELNKKGQDKSVQITQAEGDLDNLESQEGQQNNKLLRASRDTAQAWAWIKQHQDEFEKPIYGPPIVECSVKDPKYVDLVESLFSKTDFTVFTVQTRGDYKKLSDQLYGRMRLVQVNIRTMTGGLDNFPPPASDENMRRYGFEGWALDYVTGPEVVLAMLCAEGPHLSQTGMSLRDTTPQQYEMLQDSPIGSWVTSKSLYKIARRREYGASATSTQVRDIKKAQIWTDQPVDVTAKRELQRNIEGWKEEIDAFKRQIDNHNRRVEQLRTEKDRLQEELKALRDEKTAKQKAISDFKGLPTRLSQQEEKLATVQKALAGVRARYQALEDKEDAIILEKAQAALDFANAGEGLWKAHISLHEAELMLIEAESDVEILTERNSAVKVLLETRRNELNGMNKTLESLAKEARVFRDACQELANNADEAMSAFFRELPEDQTSEELEVEIESGKARLELMHEGNGGVIREFEQRQKKIDALKAKLEEVKHALGEFDGKIREIRDQWEPKLDEMVKKISDSFGFNMKQINCAGEVGIYKDEQDFDQWAIQIQVKFRENEPLTLLDSHRQSGGERAVSTIFYLMSLQSLTRSPFRVVDEINQGMDPRNERLVHARMVSIATGNDVDRPQHVLPASHDRQGDGDGDDNERYDGSGEASPQQEVEEEVAGGGSQYFLITPKLLHDLKYERGMKVLCIASGEYMPSDQQSIDFKTCVDVRRGLGSVGVPAAAASC